MKPLLTISISALAFIASGASAQYVSNGVTGTDSTGNHRTANIIYNVSPLPPIQQGNRIVYPSGTALVANGGGGSACNSPLTIDTAGSNTRIVCHDPVAQKQNSATDAAALADLAPAAGGALSDRNLPSDNGVLRNDRDVLR